MLAGICILVLATMATAAPACDIAARDVAERVSPPQYQYIHPQRAPHKCITATSANGAYDNTVLTVQKCVGTSNQRFRVNWPNTKLVFLGNDNNDLCIDTSGDGYGTDVHLDDGRTAYLRKCPQAVNNEFPEPTNGYWDRSAYTTLKIKGTNTCLDLRDGKKTVQQWTCYEGNVNQQWIVDVQGGPF